MNADDPKGKYLEAQRLYGEKKFSEALLLLDDLDEAFPNDTNITYARARCLVALGHTDHARSVCTHLIELLGDPRGAKLLAELGPSAAPTAPPRIHDRAGLAELFWKVGSYAAGIAVVAFVVVGVTYSLSGKEGSVAAMANPTRLANNPTYSKDVAPILNENCAVCHHPGEAVPMSLLSYDQVRPWAKSIRKMVEAREMPPWHADPAIGAWKNDRRLSDTQVATIMRWIDQGVQRGNPTDLPEPPTFTEGWKIGEPDMVFTMRSDQVLPAELEDEYRYVYIPMGFSQDRWIEAAEVRPGNLDVVHHVIVFTTNPSAPGRNRAGLGGSLGGYAPGLQPLVTEAGRALKVEAGSVMVLQMHYHKEPGKEERDRTSVGVRFARNPIDKQLRFDSIGTERFSIPAGAPDHVVEASFTLRENIHLEQLIPHMHLRGKDMKVWAKFPNGRSQDLLFVPKYDFNWQTFYELDEPIALPKGTKLYARAHFDNSWNNPFNPDPDVDVGWGLPTTAEMMYTFYIYTVDDEHLDARDPGGSFGS